MHKKIINNLLKYSMVWNIFIESIKKELCVPCFHAVVRCKPQHFEILNTAISRNLFLKHLSFFQVNFDIISPDLLLQNIIEGKPLKGKCFLTFDGFFWSFNPKPYKNPYLK